MDRRRLAAAFLALLVPASAIGQAVGDPALRDELLRMQEADQAVRSLPLDDPAQVRVLTAVDAANTARLKAIIAAGGWPRLSTVGEDGAGAAWLLAQHADADPEFQRQVLDLIEPLVAAREVKASSYAYLWDRTHAPQKYGTQGRCVAAGRWEPREIDAPGEVDARRAAVGLPPMAEYSRLVSGHCGRGD